MEHFPAYERDVLIAKAARVLGVFAILLGVASLLPGLMYFFSSLVYLGILIYWAFLLVILIITALIPTLFTLGAVWYVDNAFTGYRSFMSKLVGAFNVSKVTQALPVMTENVIGAYSVLYPVFGVLALIFGGLSIVLGSTKYGMEGVATAKVQGIVGIVLAVIGAISFYALVPLFQGVINW